MTIIETINLFLGRGVARADPLLVPPGDLPATSHGTTWLVQLRWVAVIGQLATIAFTRYVLDVNLPMGTLYAVVAVTALSNLALAVWSASRPDPENRRASPTGTMLPTVPILGLVQLLDLVLLTILLSLSGGPTNPFFVFYFVNLCLSAVVLPWGWSWIVTAAAMACFIVMFFVYQPLPEMWTAAHLEPIRPGRPLSRAHWGLLVAFATCEIVIVYFTSLLRDQLRKRGHELRAMQEQAARAQKLEALGTLAAGAAHELANPLATIAVVAREVERRVTDSDAESRVGRDMTLIQSELDSCRTILKRMSADAGQAMGEELVEATTEELLEESLDGLRDADRVNMVVDPEIARMVLRIPLVGLAQALRGIIQNALAASASVQKVKLAADCPDESVRIVVRDEGVGMHPNVLARVGDPFFTTKSPGAGTGLGVFLARAVVERLGGRLTIDSVSGRGTTVTIVLPAKTA